jgi:hypothetical protein
MLKKSNAELDKTIDSMTISKDALKEMGYLVEDTPEGLRKA